MEDVIHESSTIVRNYLRRLAALDIDERELLVGLSWLMIAAALVTFVALHFLNCLPAYGRYEPKAVLRQFAIPARMAWILQELPSVVLPTVAVMQNYKSLSQEQMIVIGMFTAHYVHRTFIYGYRIRGGKPTPFYLFILGVIFTSWNGYIQGLYHTKYVQYPINYLRSPLAIIGMVLYAFGMFVNIQSDNILRNLRAPGETGYRIPRGGAFEYISGANFFGEIVEWIGYATLTGTWTAWAFALFTMSNTIPRAIKHHAWYRQKFEDYPRNRKAVIPFIL